AGCSISGGATFENVANVDVVAFFPTGGDNIVEQLAGPPHERLTLGIFVGTWRFPQEENPGLRIADPEHGLRSRLRQFRTSRAMTNFLFQGLELLDSLVPRPERGPRDLVAPAAGRRTCSFLKQRSRFRRMAGLRF